MKQEKVLLSVDYTNGKNGYYLDSYVKNRICVINKDIHQTIADVLAEDDCVQMLYKGKPQTNIFVDTKQGASKIVGYIYRVRIEIEGKLISFDAWVTIYKVEEYKFDNLLN